MPKLTCTKFPTLKIVKGNVKIEFVDGVADATATQLRSVSGSFERLGVTVEDEAPAAKYSKAPKAPETEPETSDSDNADADANPASDLL